MDIEPLKILLFVESGICVHRKFASCGRIVQFLMIIHGIMEIGLIITNGVLHDTYKGLFSFQSQKLYIFCSTSYSIVQIALAFINSSSFKIFAEQLNDNHTRCKKNKKYNQKISKIYRIAYLWMVSSILMELVVFIYARLKRFFDIPDTPYLIESICHLNLSVCDYRYNIEFLVMICYLNVISEQITCVTESINESVMETQEGSGEIQMKLFDDWCIQYTNIKETSNMFNRVFGTQMTLMLATTVIFYITFFYTMTFLGVLGRISILGISFYVITTGLLLIELGLLSHAAQRAEHSALTLRRRLGKLTLNSVENEVYYKPAKDLLRLVTTRPIQIRAFGSVSVNMALLPSVVMFFTYYTVIALQINNIL